jgi:hypothetical protein
MNKEDGSAGKKTTHRRSHYLAILLLVRFDLSLQLALLRLLLEKM